MRYNCDLKFLSDYNEVNMSFSESMLQCRREMKLVALKPNPAEGGDQREEEDQRNLERRWDEDQMVAKKTLLLGHT